MTNTRIWSDNGGDIVLGAFARSHGQPMMCWGCAQSFACVSSFNQARKLLASMPLVPLVGEDIALQAARNFRKLRTLGIAIRKTIDTLIATSCIEKELLLLYSDRDFDPFVQHLGLRSAN
jgi:predicted nucleic acid-binding protein